MCENGQLIRYEKGIYYIPMKTPFGNSILNPNKIINRKYIIENGLVKGFYSGQTALNLLGLSTQIPNSIEICTNNETSRLRTVTIGNQSVKLRKARTTITNDNIGTLHFLELMNGIPSGFFDKDKRAVIAKWIKDNNVTRQTISQYAPLFPDKVMRNLVESEVIYHVAQ